MRLYQQLDVSFQYNACCEDDSVCTVRDQTACALELGYLVGVATRYGLKGPWIESWWRRDFSHGFSFPGTKRPGRGVGDHLDLSCEK